MANYFTDRVVQHPGRVTMTPVAGETNTYDMARAEGTVTEPGTPFNAENFNGIADQIIEDTVELITGRVFYGTCPTAASGTTDKIVTVDPDFKLVTGATIAVKFDNDCIATPGYQRKLNVNGTGAISVSVRGMTTMIYNPWSAGEVVLFTYDGTYWQMVSPTTGKETDISNQVTVAKTGGVSQSTVTLQSAKRIGNMVNVTVRVDAGAAVAAGNNVITFTMDVSGKKTGPCLGGSYNSAVPVFALKLEGINPGVTVRALGAVTASMYFTLFYTFMIND